MVKREEFSTAEARASFADLVSRAEAGEEVLITRHRTPVAAIGPVVTGRESRTVALGDSQNVTVTFNARPLELEGAERELIFDLIKALIVYDERH